MKALKTGYSEEQAKIEPNDFTTNSSNPLIAEIQTLKLLINSISDKKAIQDINKRIKLLNSDLKMVRAVK